MDIGASIGSIALLILMNMSLTLAYQASINASKTRLRQMSADGNANAARILSLIQDSRQLFISLQFGIVLLHFLTATVIMFAVAIPITKPLSTNLAGLLRYIVILPTAAAITWIFGEMLPTAIAARHTERIAVAIAPCLNALTLILSPLTRALLEMGRVMAAPFGGENRDAAVIEDEIMTLVSAGEEEGIIEEEEKAMIHSIFQLADTLVREVMVPRIDMVGLELDTPIETALDTIIKAGHSRIPVYSESIDHVEGILYAKDMLTLWQKDLHNGFDEHAITELLRPAYFVPEAKKAFDLLTELQQRKVHIAIVVDEYGGTAGMVTIEDLIEEIVGEIQDEYDFNEEAAFEQLGEHEYLCDARIDLDDLNDLLDSHLPTDTSDTLGGYIFGVLGRVPEINEVFVEDGLEVEVLGVTGRRIRKVRIRRLPTSPEEAVDDHSDEVDTMHDARSNH